MVFSNLKVLLAERRISISKMATATNISRTTLTALCSSKNTGIQFDTLNSICAYLNVSISDVLSFSPYEFKLVRNGDYLEVHISNLLNRASYRPVFYIIEHPIMVTFEHITVEDNYDDDQEYDNYDRKRQLQHEIDIIESFETFQSIIKTIPKCYVSYLNEQIMELFPDKFNDDNSDFFSIDTNFV